MTAKQNYSANLSKGTYTIASSTQARAQADSKENEDCLLVDRSNHFVGVFDGVGGRGNGRLASHSAVQTIHDGWKRLSVSAYIADQEYLQSILQDLLQQAHQRILQAFQGQMSPPEKQTSQKQPATTAAIAVLYDRIVGTGSFLTYAHVGDSRIYLFNLFSV